MRPPHGRGSSRRRAARERRLLLESRARRRGLHLRARGPLRGCESRLDACLLEHPPLVGLRLAADLLAGGAACVAGARPGSRRLVLEARASACSRIASASAARSFARSARTAWVGCRTTFERHREHEERDGHAIEGYCRRNLEHLGNFRCGRFFVRESVACRAQGPDRDGGDFRQPTPTRARDVTVRWPAYLPSAYLQRRGGAESPGARPSRGVTLQSPRASVAPIEQ